MDKHKNSPFDIIPNEPIKARVLLVVPSQKSVYGTHLMPAYPSLGLLSIAAVLEKAGCEVHLIDMDADKIDEKNIIDHVQTHIYDLIGFTAVTSTYPVAERLGRAVKAIAPACVRIIGGIHTTVAPTEVLSSNAFDFAVIGEGELTIIELARAIMTHDQNLAAINGIGFKTPDNKIIITDPRPLIENLDVLPMPARHLLAHPERFAPPDASNRPVFSIMVSRGCPGTCTYCQTKNIFGRRLRFRSPEKVVDEIRYLVQQYHAREIHFLDDALTSNRQFVRAFCDQISREPYRLNLEFANGIRADGIDEELLHVLRKAGLKNVGFGVESGSERVLERIKKGITKDQVRSAMAIAKKAGFKTWCYFIIGLPGDDEASIKETVDFAIELDPLYAKFLILKPYPGSEVYKELSESNLIFSFDYNHYGVYTAPVHRLETVSADRMLELQKAAFRRFYFRPRKLLQHLMEIRSLTKLFGVLHGVWFIVKKAL